MLVRETITRALPRTRRRLLPLAASGLAAAVGAALVAVAIGWPRWTDTRVGATWPPLTGDWGPRVGPGSVVAVAIAVLVVAVGPRLALRLAWPALLWSTWAAATAWTVALAYVGGRDGIAREFARESSYLVDASQLASWRAALPDFVDRIPITAPDHWHTHVAAHPPGALLTFVGLDRVGLDDPFWLGLVVLAIGTTAAVACCVAIRAVADERWARRAAPWLVLAPAAIWIGVSADALFAAVAAWSLALLALAATRSRQRTGYAIAAGVGFGCCLYLSYGLVLLAPIALAILLVTRRWQLVPWVAVGLLAVVAVFTAVGFAWWEAYPVLVERYEAGAARFRPYDYWVWANLAGWTCATGLAVWAALPIAARTAIRRSRPRRLRPGRPHPGQAGPWAVACVGGGAVLAVVVASLSGMSKAEVERIWLPFTWWALTLAALLPTRAQRPFLAVQALGALAVEHLVVTSW